MSDNNKPTDTQSPRPFQGGETVIKEMTTYPDSGGRSEDLLSVVVDNSQNNEPTPAPNQGGGNDSK